MSIRIMCPSGTIRNFRGVYPVVERKVEMNGTSLLLRVKAKSLADNPTGLLFIREDLGVFNMENNLYIGNLPEEQIKGMLESVNTNGVLRLCDLSYQKAKSCTEVQLVPGTFLPYTNEFTSLLNMEEDGRLVAEPHYLGGFTFTPPVFCGGGTDEEDSEDDEGDNYDSEEELTGEDGIDITRPHSDDGFNLRGDN